MTEERLSTIVMGKVHVVSNWETESFGDKILSLISSGEEYKQRKGKGADKFIWSIGDHLTMDLNGKKVIFARLGKINMEFEEAIWDRREKSFKKVSVQEPKALSWSNFIIITDTQDIIFEEKLPDISIKQFTEIFSYLYKQHFSGDLSSLKIDLMQETKRIFDKLRGFDKILEVQLKVTPSNPHDDPLFKPLDDMLKNSGTKEANLKFKNKEDGLTVEDTIIEQGIALSSAGYGQYTIVAKKDEQIEKIKSKDEIIRAEIEVADEPEYITRGFYRKYNEFIHREEG
ncbi:hypothetical protein P0O24_03540 [Methanotrichaceae archaeon M04Ac]|jgi:hypothetical protein|uniref:Uncharacterized protein n=1 Tax=Candidatus Methanocrinis alkalitolerans TaxID=3033395 RepID=A0ABT5XD95_9EURY|nr:hypothetical protein [Candidatus Methanocrinis alkalitolerans]MDF0592652.1 hypothetical protein [Candidatus Methanocrinis alkalitolerans]